MKGPSKLLTHLGQRKWSAKNWHSHQPQHAAGTLLCLVLISAYWNVYQNGTGSASQRQRKFHCWNKSQKHCKLVCLLRFIFLVGMVFFRLRNISSRLFREKEAVFDFFAFEYGPQWAKLLELSSSSWFSKSIVQSTSCTISPRRLGISPRQGLSLSFPVPKKNLVSLNLLCRHGGFR